MDTLWELWEAIKNLAASIRDFLGDTTLNILGFGVACALILSNYDVFGLIPQIWCCIRAVLLCLFRVLLVILGALLIIYLLASSGVGVCEDASKSISKALPSQPPTETTGESSVAQQVEKLQQEASSVGAQSEGFEADAEANTDQEPEEPAKSMDDKGVGMDTALQQIVPKVANAVNPGRQAPDSNNAKTVGTVSLGIQSPQPDDKDNNNAKLLSPPNGPCFVPPCCWQPTCCCMCTARLCGLACSPETSLSPRPIVCAPMQCGNCANGTKNNTQRKFPGRDDDCLDIGVESSEGFLPFPAIQHSVDTQEIWKQNMQKPVPEKSNDPKLNAWMRQGSDNSGQKPERITEVQRRGPSPMTSDVENSFEGTETGARRTQGNRGGRM